MSVPPWLTQVCKALNWVVLRLLVVKLSSTIAIRMVGGYSLRRYRKKLRKLAATLAPTDMPIQLVPRQVVGGKQVAHPMGSPVGRPPPRDRAAATGQCPLPSRMGLQVERAELVDADDHVQITVPDIDRAVPQPYRCRIRFFLRS